MDKFDPWGAHASLLIPAISLISVRGNSLHPLGQSIEVQKTKHQPNEH